MMRLIPAFLCATAAGLLALAAVPAFATSHPLPLWRVSGDAGHTMYLAGSMHALTKSDYPLPAPFAAAFEDSRRLVEELNLNAVSKQEIHQAIQTFGLLPTGKTLAEVMGADWPQAKKLAAQAGIDLGGYQPFKPWLAAVQITGLGFMQAGYRPRLGLDEHFARLAATRKLPIVGLETFDQQMSFFNGLKPSVQRRFLLQTLAQAPQEKNELAALHDAWRDGNTAALAAIAARDFAAYPDLHEEILGARNRRWLPTLERCLAGDQDCFVVVGAEHMIGPHGLLALLKNAGYQVVQMDTGHTPAAATSAGT